MESQLYKPHINARMNRELMNIRMKMIACKEKLTHVYLSSFNNMHMHCFSASLFVLNLKDFSQMFWKNCSLKGCFPFKTTVAHLHSLKSSEKQCVSETSDLFDTALPVITCVSGVSNQ